MLLFRYLPFITQAPAAVFTVILAFVVSMLVGLSFHEFSHAAVADRLGDHTARRFGRLTLNPRAHLDPVGALMILFVGFGWARPTPVNPYNTRQPRLSMVLIALGGPVSNLIIAFVAGLPLRLEIVEPTLALARNPDISYLVGLFLTWMVSLNVVLAVFNLLPLAPLDGFRVLVGLLPPHLGRELSKLEQWGPGILMLLFFLPFMTGYNPLFLVMNPLLDFFTELAMGVRGGIFG
jgi:Zn-dependent protease